MWQEQYLVIRNIIAYRRLIIPQIIKILVSANDKISISRYLLYCPRIVEWKFLISICCSIN